MKSEEQRPLPIAQQVKDREGGGSASSEIWALLLSMERQQVPLVHSLAGLVQAPGGLVPFPSCTPSSPPSTA